MAYLHERYSASTQQMTKMSCKSSKSMSSAEANIDGIKRLLCLTHQIFATPLIPPSFHILPFSFVYMSDPCNLALPCSASSHHTLLYLSNSQDLSLPISVPPSIACCLSPSLDISDYFLSISLSPSRSLCPYRHSCPWPSSAHCSTGAILDSHQEGGSFYHSHAKRLSTCHEKIVECQGHKKRGVWKKC